jgi:hypothetical protein
MVKAIRICFALLCALGATVAKADTWAPVAKQGTQFTLTEPACIRYGIEPNWSPCMQRAAGVIWCTDNEFAEPAETRGRFDKECQKRVADAALVLTDLECVPSSWFGIRLPEGPATLPHPHAITYGCDNGKRVVQLYSDAERDSFVSAFKAGSITSAADVTAWRKAQPVYAYTAEELAYRASIAAQYAPTPAPVSICKITAQSATVLDRQVYKSVSATGTASGSISGVRIAAGTVVPCAGAIGNYYNVSNLKDTQGRVIAIGWAIGTSSQ